MNTEQNDAKLSNIGKTLMVRHFDNAIQGRTGKVEITLMDKEKGDGYIIIMRRRMKKIIGRTTETIFEPKNITRTTIALTHDAIELLAVLANMRKERREQSTQSAVAVKMAQFTFDHPVKNATAPENINSDVKQEDTTKDNPLQGLEDAIKKYDSRNAVKDEPSVDCPYPACRQPQ